MNVERKPKCYFRKPTGTGNLQQGQVVAKLRIGSKWSPDFSKLLYFESNIIALSSVVIPEHHSDLRAGTREHSGGHPSGGRDRVEEELLRNLPESKETSARAGTFLLSCFFTGCILGL